MKPVASSLEWRGPGLIALMLLLAAPAMAAQEDTFPREATAAYREYERDVDVEKWLDGPVVYITLDHERESWKRLETDEERREFIEWFWARRDLDSRDEEHPARTELYKRVAYANTRFREFPKGWRSDRGRVWIVLGPPSGGMRRTDLTNWGRCSMESGESWTYYTRGMAFNSSMGEFLVVFSEARIGQFQICDPYMMGPGGWPRDVLTALEFTNEAMVIDAVTEFAPHRGGTEYVPDPDRIVDAVGTVEPLTVPLDSWGEAGVAGVVVLPIELPLRKLLFEPGDTSLKATMRVEASLVAMGDQQGNSGQQQWTLEIDADASSSIGGASLRTALVLPGSPGGYSARVRVVDPLSGTAWVWDGSVEISDNGGAASPPLVGRTLVRLREGSAGEVAVLAPDLPLLAAGEPFVVVSWIRGVVLDVEGITLTLFDDDGVSHAIDGEIFWNEASTAGPLIVRGVLPELAPGMYTLRLSLSDEIDTLLTRLRVQ